MYLWLRLLLLPLALQEVQEREARRHERRARRVRPAVCGRDEQQQQLEHKRRERSHVETRRDETRRAGRHTDWTASSE